MVNKTNNTHFVKQGTSEKLCYRATIQTVVNSLNGKTEVSLWLKMQVRSEIILLIHILGSAKTYCYYIFREKKTQKLESEEI